MAGVAGGVHVSDMELALRRYSAMRRAVQQAAKAAQRLAPPAPYADERTRDDPPHAH